MLRAPMLRSTLVRATRLTTSTSTAVVSRVAASTHAISNPTLANIEKRWEGMPPQEQAELWMALRDRMKENWKDLTLQEKKAGEFAKHRLKNTLRQSCACLCVPSGDHLCYGYRARCN